MGPMTVRSKESHAPARIARTALACGLCALFAGCASDTWETENSDPSSFLALAGAARQAPLRVPVFVTSMRRDDTNPESRGRAHFSLASVSVPPNHRPGVIERAAFGAARASRDFTISSRRNLEEADFAEEIAEQASSRGGATRDILLYVHGYDISLDEARFRVAQIAVDAGFAGVVALFTWDSVSRSGLFAYEADKESATVARDALEKLALDLSRVPSIGRVHILAHSMGAWLAMESLRTLAISGHPDLDGRLGEVMLAAPDIDLGVFAQQLSRVGPEHVSIFVSSTDRALSLSSRIAGNRPRLGAMNPSDPKDRQVLDALGVSVHDLSKLNTDFTGHNTFAEAPAVVRRIGAQLAPREDESAQAVAEAADARE
ncbi:alpha/beta fold hydrolase [Methylocystis sp. IM3]|uniref:alpha/beta hydrolase n=1 Tax=unclassified Methylocystis TaxID=2625913 RepID=UPI0030F5C212